jgi:hypothetical protein
MCMACAQCALHSSTVGIYHDINAITAFCTRAYRYLKDKTSYFLTAQSPYVVDLTLSHLEKEYFIILWAKTGARFNFCERPYCYNLQATTENKRKDPNSTERSRL